MIICDTNLVSEVVKPVPSPRVLDWYSTQSRQNMYLTTISVAELLFGVANSPPGKRSDRRQQAIQQMIDVFFRGRVLPFGLGAARHYGQIMFHRQAIGRPITEMDCMIAAIAISWGGAVATRDAGGFLNCGVKIINPWVDN